MSLIEHWKRDGYVLLRDHLAASEHDDLGRWVQELADWPEEPGKWMKWYERTQHGRQLCRVEDFVPYHAGLRAFLQQSSLAAVLEQLMGEPAVLYKEKINFKLPGGAGFAPHQDAPAFITFGQSYHVTIMISIDHATRENGCLEVVDGLAGAGLLPSAADGTLQPEWVEQQVWKPIEMMPRDVLLFDSYLPHRSGPNRTERPRRALYVTYNRASLGSHRDAYFQKKRQAFPPECERQPGVDYSAQAAIYNLGNPIV